MTTGRAAIARPEPDEPPEAPDAAKPPVQGPAQSKTETRAETKAETTRAALLTGPVLPTLFKLALPTMTVLLAQTAVNVAEAYYVGFLGTDALAGVAMVFPLFMLMTMMSNGGIGSGVSSSVARAIGASRKDDADAIVFHGVVLAVIAGGLFTLGTAVGGPVLYRALGGQGGALDAALQYSNYLFAGAIPVWIVNLQAAALRGSGNVRVPAIVTLIGALVMIPLSPLLIFGLGPVPGLGIGGAGIAFGLYYCGAMLVLLRYMASGRSGLHFRTVPLQWRLFADILKVGLPTAANAVLVNLTVILVTSVVGRFGTAELAAYGIASRLDYIMIPILFGLCTATLTMVGINIGAGHGARARTIAWVSALTGSAFIGTIGCVVALHPPLWLSLFSNEPEVLREGATYLRIVAPAYIALGFGFVLAFAGQGAGHTLWPFVASVLRIVVAAGGGWFVVSRLHGGMAMLASMVTLSLIGYVAICSTVLWSRSIWRLPPR
jgi:putative MATE family efflux protein